jgi:LEA14-like dessication related protein
MLRARTAAGFVAAALLLGAGCAALAPRPLPPKVELAGLRVTRLAPADTRIRIALDVQNPNAYALAVSALDATVTVEGERFATATLASPVTLAATADTRVELEARTDFAAVAAVADRVARERKARYEVAGSAVVQDGLRLPFAKRGELPVGDLLGARK